MTDNGTEFTNNDLKAFSQQRGINNSYSAPRTPQQNGFVEREGRTIREMSATILNKSKMPQYFWNETVNCSAYLLNRLTITNSKTPYELWHGRKPDVSNLRIFGQQAIILNDSQHHSKFEQKRKLGIFIGYTEHFNTYKFYEPASKKTIISCNAKFMNEIGLHNITNLPNIIKESWGTFEEPTVRDSSNKDQHYPSPINDVNIDPNLLK